MIGLIKKEFLMLKSNIKTLGIIIIIYVLMAIQGSLSISSIPSFLGTLIMVSNFSYDEFNKWDAYLITLPNGRKNSVKARYISTIILNLIITLFVILLGILISLAKSQPIIYKDFLSEMFITFLIAIAMQSFIYPITYKFGMEKSRILIFVFIFAIIAIGSIIIEYVNLKLSSIFINFINNFWSTLIPITVLIILLLSYKISERIYSKKEF